MEIIVTDERDERFIEFCASFGCRIEDPQVVLLLDNFGKIVGCSSLTIYDADSAEFWEKLYEIEKKRHDSIENHAFVIIMRIVSNGIVYGVSMRS